MLEEVEVVCPYCGAGFSTLVDCSAGDLDYVEDCQVCCAPINFSLQVGADGGIAALHLRRDDE